MVVVIQKGILEIGTGEDIDIILKFE